MTINKTILIFIFFLVINFKALASEDNIISEKLVESHTFKKLAINTKDVYRKTLSGDKYSHEIFIQPYKTVNENPMFEEPIWSINTRQLPLTEDHCDEQNIDICDEGNGFCYKPCIIGAADFLAFDETKGKLYLQVPSSEIGTGGGTYFLFVADINTKEIKYFKPHSGPLRAEFSPSNRYLLLITMGSIEIYDTITNKSFEVLHKSIFRGLYDSELHSTSNIQWLNNEQFTYNDNVRNSKFSNDPIEITQYKVDISSQKTSMQKVIKAKV